MSNNSLGKTALKQYERLESTGIWKENVGAVPTEVIVGIGNEMLIIRDTDDRPLSHWSLKTIQRINHNVRPAVFSPNIEQQETLEIQDGDMVDAIKHFRTVTYHETNRPGYIRQNILKLAVVVIIFMLIFWLPNVLTNFAMNYLPKTRLNDLSIQQIEIIEEATGKRCHNKLGQVALGRIALRLNEIDARELIVFPPAEVEEIGVLLDGTVYFSSSLLIRLFEPEALAGLILQEKAYYQEHPPLKRLLDDIGLIKTIRLLITGNLPEGALKMVTLDYLNTRPLYPFQARDTTIKAIKRAKLPHKAYVNALIKRRVHPRELSRLKSITSPYDQGFKPILRDSEWVALQEFCSERILLK